MDEPILKITTIRLHVSDNTGHLSVIVRSSSIFVCWLDATSTISIGKPSRHHQPDIGLRLGSIWG